MNILKVRNLDFADLEFIAKLHIDHMHLSFPKCKYYFNLLKIAYSSLLNESENICLVAEIEQKIVGYICLVKSLRKMHSRAFIEYPLNLFNNVIMLIFRFPILFLKRLPKRLKASLLANSNKQHTKLKPDFGILNYELRPMVVRVDYQGTSAAHDLISYAEKYLMWKCVKNIFCELE